MSNKPSLNSLLSHDVNSNSTVSTPVPNVPVANIAQAYRQAFINGLTPPKLQSLVTTITDEALDPVDPSARIRAVNMLTALGKLVFSIDSDTATGNSISITYTGVDDKVAK